VPALARVAYYGQAAGQCTEFAPKIFIFAPLFRLLDTPNARGEPRPEAAAQRRL
jgi:hypothetical protein